jgi:RNA polymerase sigma factor (sigma-70 family)
MPRPNSEDPSLNGQRFHTTRWSLVARVAAPAAGESEDALDELCAIYWRPVYAEIRRRGIGPEDAQDLTQEFFVRLLRHNAFGRAEPEKGRLRSYLLAALDHFMVDHLRHRGAAKRGGGEGLISINSNEGESWFLNQTASAKTPAESFDHGWALILMDRALSALRREYEAGGRKEIFEISFPFLAAEDGAKGYDEASAASGMTPEAFKVAVYRLRKRFRLRVREQVELTVADPGEVDQEMKHLFGI